MDAIVAQSTSAAADARAARRPLVRMQHVDKMYSNGTLALKDLSLDIRANEFVSLLGPSGCGKSTALRIFAGLGSYTAGSVEWPQSSYDVSGKPEREVGFVFQEPTLMPWATVLTTCTSLTSSRTVLRLRSRSRCARRWILSVLGVSPNAYPRELSGGMKMRVSVARALVTRPSSC